MSDKGEFEEFRKKVEKSANDLYSPRDFWRASTGYADILIDMTMMSEDDRRQLNKAEMILRSLGIDFDICSGGGYRTWHFDWSLTGAIVVTKGLECQNPECQEPCGGDVVYWHIWHEEGLGVRAYPYCCADCRQSDKDRRTGTRQTVMEIETGLDGRPLNLVEEDRHQ